MIYPNPAILSDYFNITAYGAKIDNITDDTTAWQAAITAAINAGGGVVYHPGGTSITTAGVTCSSPLVSFKGVGRASILKSNSINPAITITGNAFVEDMVFDGGGTATNAAVQSVITESSYPSLWKNVEWRNATSYQYVNERCEDVTYLSCTTPGNELNTTTILPAMQIIVPNGMCKIISNTLFGKVDLSYQSFQIDGTTLGPIFIENAGPNIESILSLDGCYIYDGGSNNDNCINTSTNLSNIVATGCYFIAQIQRNWINGNLPSNNTILLNNCSFIWGPATAGTNYVVSASGSGSVHLSGYNNSVGAGTFNIFNAVGAATTRVSTTDGTGHTTSGYGLTIMTDATDGQSGALLLKDIGTGNTKSIRMDAGNNLQILNNAFSAPLLLLDDAGVLQIPSTPAFVAGDHYLVMDASGNIHKSSLGPAS